MEIKSVKQITMLAMRRQSLAQTSQQPKDQLWLVNYLEVVSCLLWRSKTMVVLHCSEMKVERTGGCDWAGILLWGAGWLVPHLNSQLLFAKLSISLDPVGPEISYKRIWTLHPKHNRNIKISFPPFQMHQNNWETDHKMPQNTLKSILFHPIYEPVSYELEQRCPDWQLGNIPRS